MPADHTGHVARLRRVTATALAVLALLFAARPGLAQSLMEDTEETSKYYLLSVSGLVGKTPFTNVRCLLILDPAPPEATNEYVIAIHGWPHDNGDSTFVWNSNDSLMQALSGRVTCRIINAFSRSPNILFYYLSPVLLTKREGMLTQQDDERLALAKKQALPTKILATAGELTLNFSGQQVTGQVWLSGYDFVQKANVRYQATIYGERSRDLETAPTRHRRYK